MNMISCDISAKDINDTRYCNYCKCPLEHKSSGTIIYNFICHKCIYIVDYYVDYYNDYRSKDNYNISSFSFYNGLDFYSRDFSIGFVYKEEKSFYYPVKDNDLDIASRIVLPYSKEEILNFDSINKLKYKIKIAQNFN